MEKKFLRVANAMERKTPPPPYNLTPYAGDPVEPTPYHNVTPPYPVHDAPPISVLGPPPTVTHVTVGGTSDVPQSSHVTTQMPQPGHVSTQPPQITQVTVGGVQQPPQVTHVTLIQPVYTGSCPICHKGNFVSRFSCWGYLCAIFLFPIGIAFCLCCTQYKRCNNCGYRVPGQ